MHVAGGGGNESEAWIYRDSKASAEGTGKVSLLGQWMGKLRLGAEKLPVQSQLVGGAHGTALVGPDLCPRCLRALLHEGAGWARERPGALPALDLVPGCLETDM